jgi:hypothetical protein
MAFPSVAAVNGGFDSTASTSHTFNLPSGIVSGNLLIMFGTMTNLSSDPTMTWPAGWTQLYSQAFDGTDAVFGKADCYFRRADGGEGGSITVTVDVSSIESHTSYRITGHHTTTDPEGGSATGGKDVNPNPPDLNPAGWGAEDTLWIAAAQYGDNQGPDITGFPASYTNTREDSNTVDSSAITGTARRELNAASENPGTFTATSHIWGAGTVAIRPAAAAAGVHAGSLVDGIRLKSKLIGLVN